MLFICKENVLFYADCSHSCIVQVLGELHWKAFRARMYQCALCGSLNKEQLFHYTALTDWFCNRDGVCLLRGTFCPHSVFMCFVCLLHAYIARTVTLSSLLLEQKMRKFQSHCAVQKHVLHVTTLYRAAVQACSVSKQTFNSCVHTMVRSLWETDSFPVGQMSALFTEAVAAFVPELLRQVPSFIT
jgi:hypothetical protein